MKYYGIQIINYYIEMIEYRIERKHIQCTIVMNRY